MLRVTIITRSDKTLLKAEGKLTGPWVNELGRCWEIARHSSPTVPTVVDLSDVSYVDDSGKSLVRRMCSGGTELVVHGPLMTSLVHEVRTEMSHSTSPCIKEVQ